MHIAAAGDRALLITLPGASSAHLRAAAECARDIVGVVAAIVGHESIYVIGTSDAAALQSAVERAVAAEVGTQKHHRIEVSFEEEHGLDLPDFLAHVHARREEFFQRLPSIRLSVRYLGFRAGFAYLEGWPAEWAMPRRSTSRNRVPAGSFGVAGAMSGFYPVDSPGGWNILGRTAAPLWDPAREPPNLFAPGDEIEIVQTINVEPPLRRFEPAESRLYIPNQSIAEVITPGQLTTIVGPPDWTRLDHGLAPGGMFDEEVAAMANAAVGNPPDAPLLECVLVGPKLQIHGKRRVAFCDGTMNVRETVDVGRIHGMRGYLAIEGGIDEQRLRYAEAPTVVRKGEKLFAPLIRPSGTFSPQAGRRLSSKIIRVMRGPHDGPPLPEDWEVTPQMNRVGIRLRPLQTIEVKLPTDLPSCGAQFGTLQWHADGTVMALGPDHPVTGGYLQPATVISSERWKLAQLAPGDRVKLIAE
jgi:KipI family sensor histidine kinase inhibitor